MEFKKVFRLQDWWSHILPPIFIFYYCGLFHEQITGRESVLLIYQILLTAFFTGISGFFINDLFDIKEDALAGKYNFADKLPTSIRYLFLPFLVLLFITLLQLTSEFITVSALNMLYFTVAVHIFLFLLYSIPFIRFKSHPFIALFTDALYSGTLFYILAYFIISSPVTDLKTLIYNCNMWVILGWGFTKGVRNYLTHLIEDNSNNMKSGQYTLTIKYGTLKIQKVVNYLFPIELVIILCFFISKKAYFVFPIILIILFFFIWILILIKPSFKRYMPLNDYYEIWLPILILVQLVYLHRSFYPLFIIHTILFPQYLNKIYFYTIFQITGPLRKNGNNI